MELGELKHPAKQAALVKYKKNLVIESCSSFTSLITDEQLSKKCIVLQ